MHPITNLIPGQVEKIRPVSSCAVELWSTIAWRARWCALCSPRRVTAFMAGERMGEAVAARGGGAAPSSRGVGMRAGVRRLPRPADLAGLGGPSR